MAEKSDEKYENKFQKEQPLRHPMAVVARDENKIKINKQLYRIRINRGDAIDLEVLRKKYDPYLDQYDFLVGDISSDHLRLKGFYKDNVRTAIDKKENTIADYLIEYCNPGTDYFVLELIAPVHHHKIYSKDNKRKFQKRRPNNHTYHKNNFKKRRVHKTKLPKRKTIAVQKNTGRKHSFVIKKRKKSEDE
ncbi:MAG: YutD family protein [Lactobacillus sp.]|nr:YutD family protein [Lactobacillus sp.]